MSWSPKDVAAMAARLEAQGVRQSADFYEGLRQAVRSPGASPTEATQARPSKFGSVCAEADGITFHSTWERDCYLELKLRDRAGDIRNLRLQVPFVVSETTDGEQERYIVDFLFEEAPDWRTVAADAKGFATREFKRKARRFRKRFPDIELRIIER